MAGAAVLLAGCSDLSGWMGGIDAPAFPPDAPVVESRADPGSQSPGAYCDGVASARAVDARMQDFEDAVVQHVQQVAYADCMKWAGR